MIISIGDVAKTKLSDLKVHNIIQGICSMFGMCWAINGKSKKMSPEIIRIIPIKVNG